MLKNMYELARYEATTKEPEALEAAEAFREVADDDFDEWRVDSGDNCDCVILDPKSGKKEKCLSNHEEQCFPRYHDRYTETKKISDNFEQGNLDIALQAAKDLTETDRHYSKGFTWVAIVENMRGNYRAAF